MSNTNIVVKVSTGKKRFTLDWDGNEKILKIETKSPPEKGKANQEILKELKKFFEAEAYLVSGKSSKNKIIGINMEQKSIIEKLSLLKKQN